MSLRRLLQTTLYGMLTHLQAKIKTVAALRSELAGKRLLLDTIVFTNGCFDLLHPGHLTYLAQARELGSYLVVGVNSDASVRRLKGPTRPLLDEQARAFALASLVAVDAVCLVDADTPYDLIAQVQPDILVKGGDYDVATIVGADVVQANGGQVLTLPLVEGYSTTKIVERMR